MKKLFTLTFVLVAVWNTYGQSVPAYVSTDSLLAWYPFTGNANNTYNPTASMNGRVTSAVLTNDRYGNPNSAYHFDGDTSRIAIDTAFFNTGWDNYTISLWFNSDTPSNPISPNYNQCMFNTFPHHGIALSDNWGTSDKYSLWLSSNPLGSWDMFSNAKTNDTVIVHTWRHYMLIKKYLKYSVYIDDVLDSVYTPTTVPPSNFYKLIFGNIDSNYGHEGFWGALDDYGIWNRAFAPCEVRRMFYSSPYTYLTGQPANASVATLATVHFTVTDTGAGNTYQWQENAGTGFVNLASSPPYAGVTTNTLTITGVTNTMNGYKYRCVVVGAQTCVDTSAAAKLNVGVLAVNNVNSTKISIAPNPATTAISILGASNVNIEIYNSVGQLVTEAYKTQEISVGQLPAGLYIIKLYNEQGALLYADKLVKK